MKRLSVLIVITAMFLASCSGGLWYSDPRNVDDGNSITITFELPGPVTIPWTLTDGQTAQWRRGKWVLIEGGIIIDEWYGEGA